MAIVAAPEDPEVSRLREELEELSAFRPLLEKIGRGQIVLTEAATKRYEQSVKDIGGKMSTDKGGSTEKLRAAHTKRGAK